MVEHANDQGGQGFVAKSPEEALIELTSDTKSQPTTLDVLNHPRFIEHAKPEMAAENAETLQRFVAGLCELQTANSEIVGTSLFGSRLKGEATAKSDVDCTILIDADALKAQGVSLEVQTDGKLKWSDPHLYSEFNDHFGTFLASKTDKDPSTIMNGIYVQPISNELIIKQLDATFAYYDRVDTYQKASERYATADWQEQATRPEYPDYIGVGGVSALFAAELTSSPRLKQYRQMVIDTLSPSSHGEQVWQDILSSVQFGEGHFENDDPNAYPQTLAAAREYWRLEEPSGPSTQ